MRYRTIVADPPWFYENGAVPMGGVDHQYGTMSNAAIATIPVRDMAEANAHLYLWVTNPRLFREPGDGLGPREILDAWGFRYVTMLTWHKLGAPGLGYYFRGDTEHVLFGIRGKVAIPGPIRVSNHFAAARTGHSAKPDRFYEIVERVSPEPRLELFARRRRFGWDVWGNEAPDEQASQAPMGLLA